MCIMEVREGQRSSTIAQACAHNVSTVERDLDMFEALLKARIRNATSDKIQEAQSCLQRVYDAHKLLKSSYETLLAAYAAELDGTEPTHDHPVTESHTHERPLTAVPTAVLDEEMRLRVRHDDKLARKYETR